MVIELLTGAFMAAASLTIAELSCIAIRYTFEWRTTTRQLAGALAGAATFFTLWVVMCPANPLLGIVGTTILASNGARILRNIGA